MPKSQQYWVRYQHPPTQWNLRGGRWSSVEYSTYKGKKKNPKNHPVMVHIVYLFSIVPLIYWLGFFISEYQLKHAILLHRRMPHAGGNAQISKERQKISKEQQSETGMDRVLWQGTGLGSGAECKASVFFLFISVADPWHFGVDPVPDLDPQIHA